jgi:MoaA/NifB/PqqE/SkfB family radical SAM enzyme
MKNVVPMISLEGGETDTDDCRGEGTYARIQTLMKSLSHEHHFFGTSLTLTRQSFSTITDTAYIQSLVEKGCRLFLFLDYSPTQPGTEDCVLSDAQRDRVTGMMRVFKKQFPALFVAVPWDEVEVGGCLSAGRGFIHVNAQGDVEPCPFAPFSDANLNQVSLEEALRSEFLESLRSLPELSRYSGGGCALWKNREQVKNLLEKKKNGAPVS